MLVIFQYVYYYCALLLFLSRFCMFYLLGIQYNSYEKEGNHKSSVPSNGQRKWGNIQAGSLITKAKSRRNKIHPHTPPILLASRLRCTKNNCWRVPG